MNYTEIEDFLKEHGKNSAIEQLRVVVGHEASTIGVERERSSVEWDECLVWAQEGYARDITDWLDGESWAPDPQILLKPTRRYTESWAFARIINDLSTKPGEDEWDEEQEEDTLVRICTANAELGMKLVELIGESRAADQLRMAAKAMETVGKMLDNAGAPELSHSGLRQLAAAERLEILLLELAALRSPKEDTRDRTAEEIDQETTAAGEATEPLRKAFSRAVKNLCWIADQIHQAYHDAGAWKECCVGVCGSMEHVLAESGLDKDLKQIEAVP